jgi:signal peptide peptidase SppA
MNYADEYLGPWCMELSQLEGLAGVVRSIDITQHLAAARANPPQPQPAKRQGNIAVIELTGALMKMSPSLFAGTSTVEARRQLRQAAADPAIKGILLFLDSGGGTAAGTEQLAAEILRARDAKPVIAYVDDIAASAAYWAAASATRIVASPGAQLGSIGTYTIVADTSEQAIKQGVKIHVVRSTPLKGAGVDGAPVTAADLAQIQHRVDATNNLFVQGVALGRRVAIRRVTEQWADARVHIAAQAVAMGLADLVGTIDDAMAMFPQ